MRAARIMICVFLVVVRTQQDMVLIRRANPPETAFLKELRQKLVSDNVDYEMATQTNGTTPSSIVNITSAITTFNSPTISTYQYQSTYYLRQRDSHHSQSPPHHHMHTLLYATTPSSHPPPSQYVYVHPSTKRFSTILSILPPFSPSGNQQAFVTTIRKTATTIRDSLEIFNARSVRKKKIRKNLQKMFRAKPIKLQIKAKFKAKAAAARQDTVRKRTFRGFKLSPDLRPENISSDEEEQTERSLITKNQAQEGLKVKKTGTNLVKEKKPEKKQPQEKQPDEEEPDEEEPEEEELENETPEEKQSEKEQTDEGLSIDMNPEENVAEREQLRNITIRGHQKAYQINKERVNDQPQKASRVINRTKVQERPKYQVEQKEQSDEEEGQKQDKSLKEKPLNSQQRSNKLESIVSREPKERKKPEGIEDREPKERKKPEGMEDREPKERKKPEGIENRQAGVPLEEWELDKSLEEKSYQAWKLMQRGETQATRTQDQESEISLGSEENLETKFQGANQTEKEKPEQDRIEQEEDSEQNEGQQQRRDTIQEKQKTITKPIESKQTKEDQRQKNRLKKNLREESYQARDRALTETGVTQMQDQEPEESLGDFHGNQTRTESQEDLEEEAMDPEVVLSRVLERVERRMKPLPVNFQGYVNSTTAMRRSNQYLRLKYVHGLL